MRNIIVTGAKGKLSCKTADWLKEKPGFKVKQLSVRNDEWKDFDFSETDCIVHIAGVTPQNAKSDSDYENINFLLTESIAKKAKNEGVKHFIYISSMAVYGIDQRINRCEGRITDSTPTAPTDDYGKSKLKAEKCLRALSDADFNVSIIRVPSIFDRQKTEYMDEYKYLAEKYPVIPAAFKKNYKSFIFTDDLCELIYLTVENNLGGIICPDDGKFSAFDLCRLIHPEKMKSRLLGILIELFMKNNPRIIDYYGAVYYSDGLTNVFDGKYRITDIPSEIGRLYE